MNHTATMLITVLALSACGGESKKATAVACTNELASMSELSLGGPNAGNDPLGYPGFTVSGCALIYVNGAGDLVTHARIAGAGAPDKVLEPAARMPRRPSAREGLLTWEYEEGGTTGVVVLDQVTNERTELRGDFHHAGEPRSTGSAVVFTAWKAQAQDSDTDVYAYRLSTKRIEKIFGGPGQQRFADGNRDVFVASDFSEDSSGVFSLNGFNDADTVVWRESEQRVTKRALPGKQAFPIVSDSNQVIYLDWSSVHPEPKLSGYTIRKGGVSADPALDVDLQNTLIGTKNHMRPSVSGERITYLNGNALLVSDPNQAPRVVASGDFLATTLVEGNSGSQAPQVLASVRLPNNSLVTRIFNVP
jgi:hypothetical protein